MLSFLQDILTDTDISDLREILDFSLDPKIDLGNLQEKIAYANYFQAKLTKIIFKLRLTHADLETEFESWFSIHIHNVVNEYDGFPELLKTHKDYEREIKKNNEYTATQKILRKLEQTIKSLETKEKELSQFDWKIKGIIDIHKIQHNIMY